MSKKRLFVVISLILVFVIAMPISAQGPALSRPGLVQGKSGSSVYLVQMIDDPVVAYEGDIQGYRATKPDKGKKIDPNHPDVVRYASYLNSKHNQVAGSVGATANKLYDYVYSFNGFAAELSPDQVAALEGQAGVVFVWKDELRQVTTDNSPDFLGLNGEDGLWDLGYKGEDVIIGVIDTGIWPEHPSFSDRTGTNPNGKPGKLDYQQIPGWHGMCVPGEEFNASHCNQKLIGAQYYYLGFGLENITNDYLSARDHDGHGTHTASTAGGNAGVDATILGNDLGEISGIAPRARIAAYKACWNDEGCSSSDLVAAIDQAVADGVDVINYSIGSSATSIGPDDISFLFAADAGVWVATSAGNNGPNPSTVGSPATVPWLISVGASTQNRTYQGSASSSDGWEFFGASITAGTAGEFPLVDSADVGSELCIPGDLDPSLVAGNIVLCSRGLIARVDKSLAVYMAGGEGMVLYNSNDAQTQNTDNHWVPSVHINNTDGMVIKAYIAASTNPVAQINGGEFTTIPAPWMASFSSRGPNGQTFDVIKPDITAPGVNILAGNTPNPYLGAPGQLFQMIGGTSMSSPHVAGAFALLREAHPDWSPAMAKSALMTTAYQDVMKEDGVTPADPFDMGAGHLNPNPSVDPGLVYDAGFLDYLGYLCDAAPSVISAGTCGFLAAIGVPTDASNLNLPSLAIGELAGFETLQRTVTSVTPGTATYNVSVVPPAGIDVIVSPSSLTLGYGESASFEVTFTATPAAVLDDWAFGSLTWSHGPHSVRSPIAIKPVALAAPAEVFGTGTDGSLSFDITFGYTGAYTAGVHGLNPADMQAGTVADDPENDIDIALDSCDFAAPFPWPCTGITWHAVTVPAGTAYARFSLFDDFTDGADDLDLYVFDSGLGFVGGSGSGTSAEQVDVLLPSDTTYFVAVHGWQTDGPDSNYTLFSWSIGLVDDAGNMSLTAPAAATLGATETVIVDWTALLPDQMYLGAVSHSNGGFIGLTLVNINTMP